MSYIKSWTVVRPKALVDFRTVSVPYWITIMYMVLLLIALVGFCILIYWYSFMIGNNSVDITNSTARRGRWSYERRIRERKLISLETSEEISLPDPPSSFVRQLLPKIYTVYEKPELKMWVCSKRLAPEKTADKPSSAETK